MISWAINTIMLAPLECTCLLALASCKFETAILCRGKSHPCRNPDRCRLLRSPPLGVNSLQASSQQKGAIVGAWKLFRSPSEVSGVVQRNTGGYKTANANFPNLSHLPTACDSPRGPRVRHMRQLCWLLWFSWCRKRGLELCARFLKGCSRRNRQNLFIYDFPASSAAYTHVFI